MSGVIVAMRRTLLSCTSLARNGLIGLAALALPAGPAAAGDLNVLGALSAFYDLNRQEIAAITTALALLGFSVVAAILSMHTRVRAAKNEARLRADIGQLQVQADRYRALLFAEPQILIAWAAGDNRPQISGDVSLLVPQELPQRILAFGTWLPPEPALRNLERLDSDDRAEMERSLASSQTFSARLPIVAGGERRIYDVRAVRIGGGSVGVAIDASEADALSSALVRMAEAHRRTLDQLSSGVAVFDAQRRLAFYNDSYRRLWDLDRDFLDANPDDSSALDRLRAARKLPEQPDFRAWKAKLHEAYRAVETAKDTWYLPDGRALGVVTTPNPEGGVTYLFDDVTESLDLARRFDGLIRVQRETLDSLAEGVAVFGSNGRAQLFNPAFAKMWKLSPDALREQPHIDTVENWCRPLFDDVSSWRTIREAITAIENRVDVPLKLERKDGSVLDCMTRPLPDGATMLTCQDITDTENVERALRESNEALEAADQMKVDFVHHVSYELRAPLTTIIGFAHFLSDPSTGPLTAKQAEYLDYVTKSTNALLALTDNILDLATIDAGAMKLELGPVDIGKAIEAAAEGIQDRLATDRIRLKVDVDPRIG